ncbi:CMGC/CDK/CDC2 protein kinase [Fusarium keratoplasticum]|uniref:CMGC/CDK/CDC2 protein kinase n=1 Tax=Fusarium keratoplasticum TaxID=1328300 RepID=A0ACC0R041_9HYPO|nr:CMGC/CDK/CDC2 protein kinase [Fusarium keratoplasticum]KAI8670599.1 CMGC/CDK/CDC2 protein kinase [Fusarium keratoplasticum]
MRTRPNIILFALSSIIYRCPGSVFLAVTLKRGSFNAVGCILAELCARKPLFPGDSEIDEIFKIFRTLGTPTEDVLPGVTSHRDFKSSFPKWQRNYDQALCNNLNKAGLELLDMTLIYDPARRISAKQACNHRYFEGFLA